MAIALEDETWSQSAFEILYFVLQSIIKCNYEEQKRAEYHADFMANEVRSELHTLSSSLFATVQILMWSLVNAAMRYFLLWLSVSQGSVT